MREFVLSDNVLDRKNKLQEEVFCSTSTASRGALNEMRMYYNLHINSAL